MSQPAVCVNIGPGQRRRRLLTGLVFLVLGAFLAVFQIVEGAPFWWRLYLFPLFCVSMLGFFQAQASTCVFLAATGKQNLDDGDQPVGDDALARQLRRRARNVLVRSLLAALLLTALIALIPL